MMQHGLMATSETFIINGNETSAFFFAREGYDVWLGNNRGSKYSRGHVKYDADNGPDKDRKAYFDYSFYELGKYDAPAQIDFVLKMTGKEKLSYVGHS